MREASSHPRYGAMSSKNPIAALEIPNKLVQLWEAKRKMQNQLCTSISKYSKLVNIRTGPFNCSFITRDKVAETSILYLPATQTSEIWIKKKIGATSILLFDGEITLFSDSAAPLAPPHSAEQSTLQLKGKSQ